MLKKSDINWTEFAEEMLLSEHKKNIYIFVDGKFFSEEKGSLPCTTEKVIAVIDNIPSGMIDESLFGDVEKIGSVFKVTDNNAEDFGLEMKYFHEVISRHIQKNDITDLIDCWWEQINNQINQ